ncbi:glycosyl transferase [Anaerobacillus alkalidiazotrophicus]|uniref:Glycosyl transferase n=1 Tax=Anaerobacillus alkalidiazotrophicus TaxID=472963 RepID=A0A1S2MD22_9BACI|nr:DUF1972 domain-containing protein [Anaerobacillus alkalidiazotrophicus]OIJ22476.1 glycosyl transferase [Anaerobacillus alkalidiazotrophicus]
MKNVFIIGSKGIPSKYGGFETFVDKLTEYQKTPSIKYHVSCLSDNFDETEYNGARCFNVKIPDIGPAKAIYYDIKSLDLVHKYIKENNVRDAIVYILACRIGPFMKFYKKKFKRLNIPVYVNPDGHEWKRAKWNWGIRQYWKLSEKLMIKNTDLAICDSLEIEKYIKKEYDSYLPKTTYISYGATVNKPDDIDENKYNQWLNQWNLKVKDYYLIVGRFVAENNYELIIREFMKSKTKKKLIIVTNIEKNKFYNELMKKTDFNTDDRIKFVGTIYEQDLLYQVRKGAFGYFHGHEVGGTNPSLLEAMATTSLNILLDVNFNREVGREAAIYFNKEVGNLSAIIKYADELSTQETKKIEEKALERIRTAYSWELIVNQYEDCFLKGIK